MWIANGVQQLHTLNAEQWVRRNMIVCFVCDDDGGVGSGIGGRNAD